MSKKTEIIHYPSPLDGETVRCYAERVIRRRYIGGRGGYHYLTEYDLFEVGTERLVHTIGEREFEAYQTYEEVAA